MAIKIPPTTGYFCIFFISASVKVLGVYVSSEQFHSTDVLLSFIIINGALLDTKKYELVELANTNSLPYSKALEINVLNENDKTLDLKIGLHQYGYNISDTDVSISYESDDGLKADIIKPGDSFYMKPFVEHNFRGKGKLLILRISGKITGEPQRELSLIGKKNMQRVINESTQWFDVKGRN